jgi:serine/threonine-protein kinase
VWLTAQDHVKILDFGLARMDAADRQQPVGFVTQSGVIVGTPAYMAPEQIEGRGADARTDVFAFGVVLSEYASGAHPFLGAAAGRAVALDGGMAEIVSRCLRKAPADRYASAGDVAAALDLVVAGGPPVAHHSDWCRTHQIAVVVLYAIAAALSWQIKEWTKTPFATALFFALGAASTIGAVLRGHLVFIERVNRAGLPAERRRSARATRLVDIFVSVMLFADGMLITERPLPSVLTLSLALGILLAAMVVEPATTRAAFGEES